MEDYFSPPSLETVRPLTRSYAGGKDWEIAEFLELLNYAQSIEASDIHLKSGEPPRIRTVRGLLVPEKKEFKEPVLGSSLNQFISYLERLGTTNDATSLDLESTPLEKDGYYDFSVKIANSSMRLSAYRETTGRALAIRFFYNRHVSLEFIGIPELTPIIDRNHGLFMATGPTGGGKTTTLAAMINHLNERESIHIATLEDPVEYIYTDKRARITQRNVPAHVSTYEEGLVSIMRQDPDVILIGELRSFEVMKTCLLAAESGHLVLTTMHASSIPHGIHRFISFFPAHEQNMIRNMLADTLIGMSNQSLLPSTQNKWVLALELMIMNTAIANLIREGKLNAIEDVQRFTSGMVTWDTRLDTLLLHGLINEDTWRRNRRDTQHPNPLIK